MCGIAGIVWKDPRRRGDAREVAGSLAAIGHRGPDGEGCLIEPGFAGGMRRLAIIDLSGGNQPIWNETMDVAVLFNGEIYNYRELRASLESKGHRFRTKSDTEVLVHLYEDEGVEFLPRLDGMFAFALWDTCRRVALLARDRYGVKPLYLATTRGGLAFASETKAMAAAGWVRPTIDPGAMPQFLRFGWIPQPGSLWKGVRQLSPAHYVTIRDGVETGPIPYWRPCIGGAARRTDAELDEEIVHLVQRATERQLVADVPVGLFLSGGLDSSLLAAAARRNGSRLTCHTIEFRKSDLAGDPVGDDARYARVLATELGLELHVHEIAPRAVELLPRLLRHMDDPAADPAIITAYLISEAARPFTKVLLSGMGADEIAGGYRRAVAARALTPFYKLPAELRRAAVRLSHAMGSRDVPDASRRPALRRVQKALARITADVHELPEAFATWTPIDLIEGLGLPAPASSWSSVRAVLDVDEPNDPLEACLAFDLASYLPSHNLLYCDKASMAASVEVRVPFLDNELSTYLLALPPDRKVDGLTSKAALRSAAKRLLPKAIIERKKTGFGAPIRHWLKHDLKPMVDALLSSSSVKSRGLLDPAGVQRILAMARRDTSDLSYTVWALLTLELWCREVMDVAHVPSQPTIES